VTHVQIRHLDGGSQMLQPIRIARPFADIRHFHRARPTVTRTEMADVK
jgi:hypothetical protein